MRGGGGERRLAGSGWLWQRSTSPPLSLGRGRSTALAGKTLLCMFCAEGQRVPSPQGGSLLGLRAAHRFV